MSRAAESTSCKPIKRSENQDRKSDKHYFIKHYLKPGVFMGVADLVAVPKSEGKAAIARWI
jgi:hypothetical protein